MTKKNETIRRKKTFRKRKEKKNKSKRCVTKKRNVRKMIGGTISEGNSYLNKDSLFFKYKEYVNPGVDYEFIVPGNIYKFLGFTDDGNGVIYANRDYYKYDGNVRPIDQIYTESKSCCTNGNNFAINNEFCKGLKTFSYDKFVEMINRVEEEKKKENTEHLKELQEVGEQEQQTQEPKIKNSKLGKRPASVMNGTLIRGGIIREP